ncbi:MAG TPA: VWA domain-containing protein [Terriglobales bacterium]|nr:VWA domain-containing protein [Terriglobales bacterium]
MKQNSLNSRIISLSSAACFFVFLLVVTLFGSSLAVAQDQQGQQQQKPGQQQAPPEAGGPQGDIGPIAIPKKKEEAPPPPPQPKAPAGMPDYSLSVDVPLVSLDAIVLTKDGQFIPGIKKDNFRVLEDGVPQQIVNFGQTQAPITAVLLVEFSNTYYAFMVDALRASYAFADSLKKDDWVAIIEYDMKPHILLDFTQDKSRVYGALNMLRIPGFSESNLFDALVDSLDRLDRIQGRKVLVVVGSGLDTFSRITYDKAMKRVKESQNVTIFTVSTGEAFQIWAEGRMGPIREMDFLQAKNQLRTFAEMTGGRAYSPRFEGEMPGIFQDIGQSVRNQYTLTYHPTNKALDGSYRKLKVELVDPTTGRPLVVEDSKNHKKIKYEIIARSGYTAKHTVE